MNNLYPSFLPKHSFWPAALDLVTAILMIFLLITYIQATLNTEDLELLRIRQQQKSFMTSFKKEFSQEIADNTIAISVHINSLQITFNNGILFEIGKHLLHDAGKKLLIRCVKIFNEVSQTGFSIIQVEGHTDKDLFCEEKPLFERTAPCRPEIYPSNNWELSNARAISVVELLINQNVEPNTLSATGYSYYKPISKVDSRNRRIELKIFF